MEHNVGSMWIWSTKPPSLLPGFEMRIRNNTYCNLTKDVHHIRPRLSASSTSYRASRICDTSNTLECERSVWHYEKVHDLGMQTSLQCLLEMQLAVYVIVGKCVAYLEGKSTYVSQPGLKIKYSITFCTEQTMKRNMAHLLPVSINWRGQFGSTSVCHIRSPMLNVPKCKKRHKTRVIRLLLIHRTA